MLLLFFAIATEGRHPLPLRYKYQNAVFWMTIRFVYIVLCGLGKSAHVHVGRFCSARRVSEQLL